MSEHPPEKPEGHGHGGIFAHLLEMGDSFAHLLVSGLLLLLALGILVACTWGFVLEIMQDPNPAKFAERGLGYLSNLLLGVIVLELLSTILTYIKARSLEATIKEFLIVGLISSIRKILLVGAQSSLEKVKAIDFINESIGTVFSILGIIILIGGLILLDHRKKMAAQLALIGANLDSDED